MSANVVILEGWLKTDAQVRDNLARFTLCFEGWDDETHSKTENQIICELWSKNMRNLGGYLKADKQVTLTGKLKFAGGQPFITAWDVAFHGNKWRGDQQGGYQQSGGGWSQGGR